MPPSFDPALRLFFVTARETCATYVPEKQVIVPGRDRRGHGPCAMRPKPTARCAPSTRRRASGAGSSSTQSPTFAGLLSTASGVVFGGDNEGNFMAFDSRTGKNLWHYQTGSSIWGGAPMTYMLDGRQYVVIGAGTTITASRCQRIDLWRIPCSTVRLQHWGKNSYG